VAELFNLTIKPLRDVVKGTYESMNAAFNESIAKTRNFTYRSKPLFGYFRSLAGQYGISFLIGIAVGVNLVLLIQMSEDIFGILSKPITGSILGIAGVVSTFVVGVTIFYMQKKAAKRMNVLIEQQHKTIESKSKQDQDTKRYYIICINSYYERFSSYYEDLKSYIQRYLEDRSDDSWKNLKRYIDNRFVSQVDIFVDEAVDDIKPIKDLLNSPRLIDKFSLTISLSGLDIKACAAEISSSQYYDNLEILKIIDDMDSAMNYIQQFMQDLNNEIDNDNDNNDNDNNE
jgi:hypothetical protein